MSTRQRSRYPGNALYSWCKEHEKVSCNVRESMDIVCFPFLSIFLCPRPQVILCWKQQMSRSQLCERRTFFIAELWSQRKEWFLVAFFPSILPLHGLCPETMLGSGITKAGAPGNWKMLERLPREDLDNALLYVVYELLGSPLTCICTNLILISIPKMIGTELINRQLPRLSYDH